MNKNGGSPTPWHQSGDLSTLEVEYQFDYDHLNESVVTTNDFEYGTRFRKREKVRDFHDGGRPKPQDFLKGIEKAAVALRSSGTLVTPLALQAASGLNIKTVRKYMGHVGH